MTRLFKIFSILLGVIGVIAFTGTAIYWFWIALTNEEVAERGGYWYVLAPLALAVISFFVFRAMARWADRRSKSLR